MEKKKLPVKRRLLALCFAVLFVAVASSPVLHPAFKIHGLIGYSLPHGQLDYGYLDGLMFRANQY
ncbi:hypothetical protein IWQ48_003786 [Labrenzia sp. EL_13]|nr:hypothetical protein [Labrenzia sp. EL_13]